MSDPDIGENLQLLIEVVSGRHLLLGDRTGSDPYVIVMLGDEEIHRTKYMSKTQEPHWGPEEDSHFILQCTAAKLYDHDLTFVIKDYDVISSDDDLGSVTFAAHDLYLARGDDMEQKITPPAGHDEGEDAGYLTIRCRPATLEDIDSLHHKGEKKARFKVVAEAFGHLTHLGLGHQHNQQRT